MIGKLRFVDVRVHVIIDSQIYKHMLLHISAEFWADQNTNIALILPVFKLFIW